MNGQVTKGLSSSDKKNDVVVLELSDVLSHIEALHLVLVMIMPS